MDRKTSELASAGPCPNGRTDLSHKGSNARFIRKTCKICGTVRGEERSLSRRDPAPCPHRHTDHMRKQCTHAKDILHCGTHIGSVLREIYNALEASRSASSNRDEELANRVLKDTAIPKRQLHLATKLMLEQVSRLSDDDYEQSAMVQLFLDCADRATEPSPAFVLFREQPTHFNDNQTLNLRVVDPIAYDGVWVIIDGGCNSCCYGEVWRQHAQAKMKVLGLQLYLAAQECNYFQWRWDEHNQREVKKNPMAIRLEEFDMVIPGCVHSHEIPEKTHLLLVSQACQEKLGMTSVRDGSITLDGYDAQSLEVARQMETALFMIMIDHPVRNDHACNPRFE